MNGQDLNGKVLHCVMYKNNNCHFSILNQEIKWKLTYNPFKCLNWSDIIIKPKISYSPLFDTVCWNHVTETFIFKATDSTQQYNKCINEIRDQQI